MTWPLPSLRFDCPTLRLAFTRRPGPRAETKNNQDKTEAVTQRHINPARGVDLALGVADSKVEVMDMATPTAWQSRQ